ncbi:MAG: hypothetical protein E6J09_02165 [Chloroflexi bacterium]|nr:MAG: hypothetical protein E6J09_02165 [Chloroflexota bacterium]
MRLSLLVLALVTAACAVPSPQAANAPMATPSLEVAATPSPSSSPEPTASPLPDASSGQVAHLEGPNIAVATTAFPVVASFALHAAPIDANAEGAVRLGLEWYLDSLDRFRESGATDRSQLSVGGRFGDAVFAGMSASWTPGVKRKFAVGSFKIDRLLVKPWGTRAVVEVTATIVDKAVDGSVPDQSETGKLRMIGDKPTVVDGWDSANGRWFNGPRTTSQSDARGNVAFWVADLLRSESWIPGSPRETSFGPGGDTPYARAKNQYLGTLDRTLSSRTFEDVTATVERYETFSEIVDGLATVRLVGTVVTSDANGRNQRQPFERRVVILHGQNHPEVVDEEMTPGVWLSGGDLALGVRDHNSA